MLAARWFVPQMLWRVGPFNTVGKFTPMLASRESVIGLDALGWLRSLLKNRVHDIVVHVRVTGARPTGSAAVFGPLLIVVYISPLVSPVSQPPICTRPPAIMRRFVCPLWCPNGRFVYRTGEGSGEGGRQRRAEQYFNVDWSVENAVFASWIIVVARSVNCMQFCCCIIFKFIDLYRVGQKAEPQTHDHNSVKS